MLSMELVDMTEVEAALLASPRLSSDECLPASQRDEKVALGGNREAEGALFEGSRRSSAEIPSTWLGKEFTKGGP